MSLLGRILVIIFALMLGANLLSSHLPRGVLPWRD